jgi:hypothetical protein
MWPHYRKRKIKFDPVHAMKACWGGGGVRATAPQILNISAGWRWSASRSSHFNFGKERRQPLSRRPSGSHSLSERFEEENNIVSLPGFKPWVVPPVEYVAPTPCCFEFLYTVVRWKYFLKFNLICETIRDWFSWFNSHCTRKISSPVYCTFEDKTLFLGHYINL